MKLKSIKDIRNYLLLDKRSLYTPIDKVVEEVYGKENIISNICKIISEDIYFKLYREYTISDDFKKYLLNNTEVILSLIKENTLSTKEIIILIKIEPRIANFEPLIALLYERFLEDVKSNLKEDEIKLLHSYLKEEFTLEDLIVHKINENQCDPKFKGLSSTFLKLGSPFEIILYIFKEKYREEILKLYIFKKLFYGKVNISNAISHLGLEEAFEHLEFFTYDLLESYIFNNSLMVYEEDIKEQTEERNRFYSKLRLKINELNAYEKTYGKEEALSYIVKISSCNNYSEKGCEFLMAFLGQDFSMNVREEALKKLLDIPKGYTHLLCEGFKNDKLIQKYLKKQYILENQNKPIENEESVVEAWCKDKKRKKDYTINFILETSSNITLLYMVRDVFINEKLKKFIHILDSISFNKDERVPSILEEIRMANTCDEITDRISILLKRLGENQNIDVATLISNSFNIREENSYIKETLLFINNKNNNTKFLSFPTTEKTHDINILIGKKAPRKDVVTLLKEGLFKSVDVSFLENILYITLDEYSLVCMVEVSIFSSKTHEYISLYPAKFINVEILDISFYKCSLKNIEFKYFLINDKISENMVDSNAKTFVYNLLARYFK